MLKLRKTVTPTDILMELQKVAELLHIPENPHPHIGSEEMLERRMLSIFYTSTECGKLRNSLNFLETNKEIPFNKYGWVTFRNLLLEFKSRYSMN